MFNVPGHTPAAEEAVAIFTEVLPEFEAAGVKIARGNLRAGPHVPDPGGHPQRRTAPTWASAATPPTPWRPWSCPREVIDAVAPYVLNMHIKDFAFSRKEGWVGFTYSGAPLGEGLLDYDYMAGKLQPKERNINQIVEHWLPWQDSEDETIRLENQWTQQSLDFLRSK